MFTAVMKSGAGVTEKYEQNRRDQAHPDEQVLYHRVRGDLYQSPSVVIRLDIHPRRQDVILSNVVDALMNAGERRGCLGAIPHQNDALNDIGRVVVADDSKSWRKADADVGHVFHSNRCAFSCSAMTTFSMS